MARLPVPGADADQWGEVLNEYLLTQHKGDGTHARVSCDDLVTRGPWVDVRAFGAKGDGTSDDTAAIQAAIDTGKSVLIPPGPYLISSKISIHADGQKIFAHGAVLQTTADITAVEIGDLGAEVHQFIGVYGLDVFKTSGGSSNPGIIASQLCNCELAIDRSRGFQDALVVRCNAPVGCAYNRFLLNMLWADRYCLWLDPSGVGWVTENTFIGGRYTGENISYCVHSPKVANIKYGQPQNNKYIGPCFEPVSAIAAVEEGGDANSYLFPRAENATNIHFNSDSSRCTFIGRFYGMTVTDNGLFNMIITLLENRLYGNLTVTDGVYRVNGTQVVGPRGAAVADATDQASAVTQLNALLARCRAHGLIES